MIDACGGDSAPVVGGQDSGQYLPQEAGILAQAVREIKSCIAECRARGNDGGKQGREEGFGGLGGPARKVQFGISSKSCSPGTAIRPPSTAAQRRNASLTATAVRGAGSGPSVARGEAAAAAGGAGVHHQMVHGRTIGVKGGFAAGGNIKLKGGVVELDLGSVTGIAGHSASTMSQQQHPVALSEPRTTLHSHDAPALASSAAAVAGGIEGIRMQENEDDDGEPLPPGWGKALDPSGKVYFWHRSTQKTTWSRPTTDTPVEQ